MGRRGPAKNDDRFVAVLEMRDRGMTYAEVGAALRITRQAAQAIAAPPADVRERVVRRAQGRCERCNLHVGWSGQVHHRAWRGVAVDAYNRPENLTLLCGGCHQTIHGGAMTEEVTEQFLTRLWQLQAEAGLHNSALSRLTGVSPSYITRLKSGARGRHLSLRVALRIAEQFPELRVFLSPGSPTITELVTEDEAGSEEGGQQ